MTASVERAAHEHKMILEAQAKGTGAKLKTYAKLSGPGWLQSAITLGGGSLAGSLFLGMLGGYSMLWLQVLAMSMGVIMLSAIAYVTLATGKPPFRAINEHVNPVLGWGWALATFMANIVWCLPQFSLGTAAVQQNLIPALADGPGEYQGKLIICAVILLATLTITMFYDSGGWGIKLYEGTLRVIVGAIVLSFFGVVVKLALTGGLPIGEILSGFIPDLSLLSEPAAAFQQALGSTGEFAGFWKDKIVGMQRDVMITAAATAVGINMTFLLPSSMLARGWNKDFRGMAIFDLSTGMLIPFVMATGCVVIASANQFHAQPAPGLLGEKDSQGQIIQPAPNLVGQFKGLLDERAEEADPGFKALTDEDKQAVRDAMSEGDKQALRDALPEGDKRMAAMLVKRDAFNLAVALEPLTGSFFANYIFGFGVLAMALSTITILMVISGFTICEMLGLPPKGWAHRLGCLAPCLGALGPFVWSGKTAFWLAVPTSIFGMALLPIAYATFFLLMNNRAILGDHIPQGGKRWLWNTLMLIALGLSAFGAGWSVWSNAKARPYSLSAVGIFLVLMVVVHFVRPPKGANPVKTDSATPYV